MLDQTVICFVQAVALFMAGAVIVFFLSRVRDSRKEQRSLEERCKKLERQTRELRSTEEETKLDREWYRLLFTNTREMVFVHSLVDGNLPGPFLEVSDTACSRLGYSREELQKKTPTDILAIDAPTTTSGYSKSELTALSDSYIEKHAQKIASNRIRAIIEQAISEGEKTFDTELVSRGGQKLPVQVTLSRLDIAEEPMIMFVARDVTNLRKGEEALQESERRLRDFFTYSPFGIAMYDTDKKLIRTNRACLGMFGIPDQEQFAHLNLLTSGFVPEDVRQRIDKGESARYEATINFDDLVSKAKCVTTRKGRGYFGMMISYMGYDRQYKPRGYMVQVEDVSERKKVEADLRRLADEGAKEGTSGSLADMSFTDMIQILCAGGRNMRIEVKRGSDRAVVFIKNGEIIHCSANKVSGDQAFYALMQWRDGDFSATQCSEFPVRTIKVSLMGLLMEGARLADEG